ncbi:MAG: hypothetical protein Ct9H300mP17_10790 [Candidatus Nitrosopelagicus sp.]|nr:MAG: hypothetical protein Ct9H300mP17_10790 [Candidatus Nitrosopelagicus sp.]
MVIILYLLMVKNSPELKDGSNNTFLTMVFSGMGKHKIEIFGTTYLDTFELGM